MKIAVFSDIHGNRQALKAIIDDIKINHFDEVICLGDIIGIGPKPKECLDLIMENDIKMLLGNHELYYVKGTDIDDEMSDMEKQLHKWVKSVLSEEQGQFLKECGLTLEKEINNKRLLFEHFLINENTKDEYPFCEFDILYDGTVNNIIKDINSDYIFIGHEHKPFVIDDRLYDIGTSGCVYDDLTRYTVIDTNTFDIKTKIVKYDRNGLVNDVIETNYPCRSYLAKGFFGIVI